MKKRLVLVLFVLFIILLRLSPAGQYLTLGNLQNQKDSLLEYVGDNYIFAAITFIGLYIIVAGLSIPGAAVMTLAGGFLFGPWLGTVYTNIGATLGALAVFLLARFLIGQWAQKKWGRRLNKLNRDIDSNGASYLLTLRFIPLFPFWLVNLAAALSRIKTKTFIWTTSIGIIPGSFAYAFAGSQLAEVQSVAGVLSPGVLLALVLLGAVSLAPAIYKKVKKRV